MNGNQILMLIYHWCINIDIGLVSPKAPLTSRFDAPMITCEMHVICTLTTGIL